MKIMDGVKAVGQQLSGFIEMTQVGPGIILTHIAITGVINGIFVHAKPGIVDINGAPSRKKLTVSGISGGHDTIKHIHPHAHHLHKIFRGAHPHDIPGLIMG